MLATVRTCIEGGGTHKHLVVWCPGCESLKSLPIEGTATDSTKRPYWTFDGNLEAPTMSPSILSRWDEWQGEGQPAKQHACHSFLRAGVWQFLGDCTHALKGQKVPMAPLPDWFVRNMEAVKCSPGCD